MKGDGQLPINAADKPHSDIFDEEAERQAFMEAVAEWRRGDGVGEKKGNITIVREYQGGKTSILKPSSTISKPSAAEAGMWNNPFSAASPPESKVIIDFWFKSVELSYVVICCRNRLPCYQVN